MCFILYLDLVGGPFRAVFLGFLAKLNICRFQMVDALDYIVILRSKMFEQIRMGVIVIGEL